MSKGRINYLRYGLVVLITLAFVVATYFIVKSPKTSCEAQGKVADPTPGHRGQCLEQCQRDKYRCLTDNCKARWDQNTGAVVCSDCEIGKIPLKDERTSTYNCVPECTANSKCNDGQSCVAINKYDNATPYYCISNLYSCKKDPNGTGGHVCVRTQDSGDSLNDCLNKGRGGDPCSCDHDNPSNTTYALNNENNACSPFACTKDGKYGYGSVLSDQKKHGTCYALDSDNGFLLNPTDDKSARCTANKTQETCNNMNKEKWQCKWLSNSVFIVPGSNDLCKKGKFTR